MALPGVTCKALVAHVEQACRGNLVIFVLWLNVQIVLTAELPSIALKTTREEVKSKLSYMQVDFR